MLSKRNLILYNKHLAEWRECIYTSSPSTLTDWNVPGAGAPLSRFQNIYIDKLRKAPMWQSSIYGNKADHELFEAAFARNKDRKRIQRLILDSYIYSIETGNESSRIKNELVEFIEGISVLGVNPFDFMYFMGSPEYRKSATAFGVMLLLALLLSPIVAYLINVLDSIPLTF